MPNGRALRLRSLWLVRAPRRRPLAAFHETGVVAAATHLRGARLRELLRRTPEEEPSIVLVLELFSNRIVAVLNVDLVVGLALHLVDH